jgi:steroid 5-alpha reductase family enzyme
LAGKPGVPPAPILALILSFGINLIAWVPASVLRTEKFYDFTGGVSFLSIIGVVLVVGKMRGSATNVLPAALVAIWAVRLSLFLLFRVLTSEHGDRRFDKLKLNPVRFFIPWTLQALWAFLTSIAMVVQVSESPSGADAESSSWIDGDLFALTGIVLWCAGFALEVVADLQKIAFSKNPKNRGRFICSGVWSWCRHPNYFGEITLWVGIFVMGIRTYRSTQWITAVSPLFVGLLLLKVSGLPMLEAYADKKWGAEAEYQEYKRTTHVMVPFLGRILPGSAASGSPA